MYYKWLSGRVQLYQAFPRQGFQSLQSLAECLLGKLACEDTLSLFFFVINIKLKTLVISVMYQRGTDFFTLQAVAFSIKLQLCGLVNNIYAVFD